MVNYKRVVCEAMVLAALVAAAAAAPAADCEERHHYDQRQNGSENYRLNIDGVVIAVAPAESLLAAASDIDFGELLDLDDFNDMKPKPPADKPPASPLDVKPQDGKPQDAKPQDSKPEDAKPDPKPEGPLSDVSLPSEVKGQRKDSLNRKQEKAQRLKMRLANMLLPLLRRNRHH